MFDSSDVQSVFSGNIAEEWEKKSRYINSLNGNDNMDRLQLTGQIF